jgi:predicted metal-dependent HD superfamily phosphohydrolase
MLLPLLPEDNWKQIITKYPIPNLLWQEIESRYSESHRKYHNLDHIGMCYREFYCADSTFPKPENIDAIQLAILFHDVIYNPRSSYNEEDSAMYFRRYCESYLSPELTNKTVDLIIATKYHTKYKPSATDVDIIKDVDLAILGTVPESFSAYEKQIRKEYDYLSDSDYRYGRKEFFGLMLEKPMIYSTPYFQQKYEVFARSNILKALDK